MMVDIKDILTLMAQVQGTIIDSKKWVLKNITFNKKGAPPTFIWQNTADTNTELQIRPELSDGDYNFVVVEKSFQGETEIAKFNAKSRIRKPLAVFAIAYNFLQDLIMEDGKEELAEESSTDSTMEFKIEE